MTDAEIGARIRSERKRRKWTQQKLADLVGVEQATVSGWELGTTISLGGLRKVAEAFGLEEVDFFTPAVADPPPRKRRAS